MQKRRLVDLIFAEPSGYRNRKTKGAGFRELPFLRIV